MDKKEAEGRLKREKKRREGNCEGGKVVNRETEGRLEGRKEKRKRVGRC